MNQKGYTVIEMVIAILMFVIFPLGLWGWVWNIVKLVGMCCDLSGMLIVRAAGIFIPPLGAVVGFL